MSSVSEVSYNVAKSCRNIQPVHLQQQELDEGGRQNRASPALVKTSPSLGKTVLTEVPSVSSLDQGVVVMLPPSLNASAVLPRFVPKLLLFSKVAEPAKFFTRLHFGSGSSKNLKSGSTPAPAPEDMRDLRTFWEVCNRYLG